MDIFSKYGIFGCFNFIIGSYDTIMIDVNFMEDV